MESEQPGLYNAIAPPVLRGSVGFRRVHQLLLPTTRLPACSSFEHFRDCYRDSNRHSATTLSAQDLVFVLSRNSVLQTEDELLCEWAFSVDEDNFHTMASRKAAQTAWKGILPSTGRGGRAGGDRKQVKAPPHLQPL